MSGYAFSSEQVALSLRDYANSSLAGQGGTQAPLGREVIFAKTPSGGIGGYDGNEFSIEDCERVYFADMEYQEDPSCQIPVVNVEETDIDGDKIIKAVRVGTHWVAVTGGGGGGGGSTNYVIVASSGITASTWATAGSGTGDIWELASGGGSWSAVGGSSVNIRNPWEETIASGSRMICYKDGDYYVVIQASCPSE